MATTTEKTEPSRAAPDPDASPIFVVGTARSGTTLLRLMLNAHPRIYLTHEAGFYLTAAGFPRKRSASEWLDFYVGTFSYAWLDLDPDEVRREVGPDLPRERIADAFRAVMRVKARHFEKPRYGDKTPFHASHLGRIFADFPDARVIHIVRDPRATVASLIKMPWAPGSLSLCNFVCSVEHREVAPFRDKLCEVRLEDLLRDPRGEMGRILDFVGEPWDDAVLDHSRNAPTSDVPPFPWLLTATGKRQKAPGEKAKSALSPAWIRVIEATQRGSLELHGYPRKELDREPGALRCILAVLLDLPRTLFAIATVIYVLARVGGYRKRDVEAAQRLLLSLNPLAWKHYPGFVAPPPPRAGRPRSSAE